MLDPPEELRGARARSPPGRSGRSCTVHNWKHAPAVAQVTGSAARERVGEVRRCRWETLRAPGPPPPQARQATGAVDPAQSGGGILVDHGWHALYVIREWLGGRPATIAARLETRKHREFPLEDTAEIRLDWNGARAEIFLTWAAEARRNRADHRRRRAACSRSTAAALTLSDAGRRRRASGSMPSLTEGSHHPDWFGGVVAEFLSEVGSPRRAAEPSRPRLCAEILALAQDSSRRGGEPLSARRAPGER